jgi:NAD(P)-dependent dehydrogenase (short-subunit alcohol dehydrogenase family)
VLPFDVLDTEKCAGVVGRAFDLFGGCDVVIFNAGIDSRGEAAEAVPAVLQRILHVSSNVPSTGK